MKQNWTIVLVLGTLMGIAMGPKKAHARVFNFATESFATYLRYQYGVAGQGKTPYAQSSGATDVFTDEYKSNPSYDFGFIYSAGNVRFRFGFEVLKPTNLIAIEGKNPSDSVLYTVTNDISGYVPKMGLEFTVKNWSQSRLFLTGEVGTATVTVQNSYSFTAAGTSAYPTLTDFREEVKGNGLMTGYGMGFESILSDTTTFAFEVGSRTLNVSGFAHTKDITNFQGTLAKGAAATDKNGNARTLNFSGAVASIWLRFWIQ